MTLLKLAALDEEDLKVISACVQDAVLKIGEISFKPRDKRLVLPINRFAWEKDGKRLAVPERRRSVLHFDRVMQVKSSGIDRNDAGGVMSILALQFKATDAPAGTVEIVFAGGATMRLAVECIEAQMADLGPAWAAKAKPKHGV
ncbi:MAG: DUF2948 family protein [Rhizobiaceae bacterium]